MGDHCAPGNFLFPKKTSQGCLCALKCPTLFLYLLNTMFTLLLDYMYYFLSTETPFL